MMKNTNKKMRKMMWFLSPPFVIIPTCLISNSCDEGYKNFIRVEKEIIDFNNKLKQIESTKKEYQNIKNQYLWFFKTYELLRKNLPNKHTVFNDRTFASWSHNFDNSMMIFLQWFKDIEEGKSTSTDYKEPYKTGINGKDWEITYNELKKRNK